MRGASLRDARSRNGTSTLANARLVVLNPNVYGMRRCATTRKALTPNVNTAGCCRHPADQMTGCGEPHQALVSAKAFSPERAWQSIGALQWAERATRQWGQGLGWLSSIKPGLTLAETPPLRAREDACTTACRTCRNGLLLVLLPVLRHVLGQRVIRVGGREQRLDAVGRSTTGAMCFRGLMPTNKRCSRAQMLGAMHSCSREG